MMTKKAPRTPVNRILWHVLLLNSLVAAAKISVGVLTGTVSIIADGIHSTVDGASNVVALIASRIANLPPDEDHPYGHERFETIGTFAIGGLLLLTAWEVLQVAFNNLLSGERPEIGALQFGVLGLTLLVNIGVATFERRAAKRHQSALLAADADHTASDVWVTISVIFSLIGVELGLYWLDAVAALLIVGLIGLIAYRILDRTTQVLVDRAPIDAERIEAVISDTPGIRRVLRARSRGAQDAIHIDLDVAVAPVVNANTAQSITNDLRNKIKEAFPSTNEVRIQIESETLRESNILIMARGIADTLGLGVHEIMSITTPQGPMLDMHVEVQPGISLQEAHEQISALEQRLLQVTDAIDIVTHIEPANQGNTLQASSPAAIDYLNKILQDLGANFPQGHWHHQSLHYEGNGYTLSIHCHLPGDISIETAHQFAERAELHLRSQFNELHRVTIHTEPFPPQ